MEPDLWEGENLKGIAMAIENSCNWNWMDSKQFKTQQHICRAIWMEWHGSVNCSKSEIQYGTNMNGIKK